MSVPKEKTNTRLTGEDSMHELPCLRIEPGAWEPGGGGKGAIAPPTFCLNGMDMPVPPLNFGNH